MARGVTLAANVAADSSAHDPDFPVVFGFVSATAPAAAMVQNCTEGPHSALMLQQASQGSSRGFPVEFGFSSPAVPCTTQSPGDHSVAASFASSTPAQQPKHLVTMRSTGEIPVEFGFAHAEPPATNVSSHAWRSACNSVGDMPSNLSQPLCTASVACVASHQLAEGLRCSLGEALQAVQAPAVQTHIIASPSRPALAAYPVAELAFARDSPRRISAFKAAPPQRANAKKAEGQSRSASQKAGKLTKATEVFFGGKSPKLSIETLLPSAGSRMIIERLLPEVSCETLDASSFAFPSPRSMEPLSLPSSHRFKAVEQKKDTRSTSKRTDGTRIEVSSQRNKQDLFSAKSNEHVQRKMTERIHTKVLKKSGGTAVRNTLRTVEVHWS